MERFRRWGSFLGLRVRCHFGLNQVLWAPGFRGPYLGGCRCRSLEEAVVLVSRGGSLVGG